MDPRPDVSVSPYSTFGSNPILNIDASGDTSIPTVDNKKMELLPNSFTTFDGSAQKLKGSSVTVQPAAGTLHTFEAGTEKNPITFQATFGSSTGKFLGYFNTTNPSQSFDEYYHGLLDRSRAMDVADKMEKDGMWDRNVSDDQAGKRALALGTGYSLPSPIFRNVTGAVNSAKGVGLSDDVANTFRFRMYSKVTLNEPLRLLRYYDDVKAFAPGRYMTNSVSGIRWWDRTTMAIRPAWNNMTKIAQWEIPAGATIYRGRAAMQFPWFGGKTQFFIPNSVLQSATRIP